MTAIIAAFGRQQQSTEEELRRALARMRDDALTRRAVHVAPRGALAAARYEWERTPTIAGERLIASDGSVHVVADASIYYRTDLVAALAVRGVRPIGDSPTELILAAYRAFGADCARHLEGDFAFVVWDEERDVVVAARDFVGSRLLYWAQLGETLVVASTMEAILGWPGCPDTLNAASIAETAACLFGSSYETSYSAIQSLLAGHRLVRERGTLRTERVWEIPQFAGERESPMRSEDAALEVRRLLQASIAARLDGDRVVATQLSGGWDSSSVFGCGQDLLRKQGRERSTMQPVSVSYPPGDSGREDEFISAIADFWGASVRWVDGSAIPVVDGGPLSDADRADAFGHPFATFNRILARACSATGAHVVFSGYGGDNIFAGDAVYLSDLLVRGRWGEMWRDYRKLWPTGVRGFVKQALLPLVPDSVLMTLARLTGRETLAPFSVRQVPTWIRADFAKKYDLAERERSSVPPMRVGQLGAQQAAVIATHPFISRICAAAFEAHRREMVELRSPIFDQRIVRFMATRPRRDRISIGETKILLRAALRDLLPNVVLAPRKTRTGTIATMVARDLNSHIALIRDLAHGGALADFGIVEPNAFFAAMQARIESPAGAGADVLFALQTELWLRRKTGWSGSRTNRSHTGHSS